MAVDVFLKVDDIKGESADDKHRGLIDVISWTLNVVQSSSTHLGARGGSGKVHVDDLHVVKYVDRATPILLKYCASGKHLKKVELVVRKAGGKPLEYVKLTLEDALVSSVKTGARGDTDRLTEDVAFNFARMRLEYVPQKADGSGDAAIPMGWDVAGNKEL